MTRRRFLQILAWCVAPLAAGWLAWRNSLFDRGTARLLAIVLTPQQRLRAHFRYLDLDSGGVDQYFADYQRFQGKLSRRSPLPAEVFTHYLLSTDFFRYGADETRRVRYVGFYDPYTTPCNNPLAGVDGGRGA
jgi:hypothetical protein